MSVVRLLAVSIVAILAAAPVLAVDVTSAPCGLQTVYAGDSSGDVLRKCGNPTARQGNIWFYDKGSSGPLILIHFAGGGATERKVWRMEIRNR